VTASHSTPAPSPRSSPEGVPALAIAGLRFSYPADAGASIQDAGRAVINVQALSLRPGEQILLTGGSGSGKSTLLYLIAGLLDPEAGTVHVTGQNIHALAPAARDRLRGRTIGMIFQTFHLLPGFSAIQNVMLAMMFADPRELPPREHRARAGELLTRLGLERGRPHNADVTRLSVGQQQRVAVARAVACKPSLVLADEPTASLDPDNAQGAIELIQSACRDAGAALLCVSHDPTMVDRFPRRLRLADLRSDAPHDAPPVGPIRTDPRSAQAGRSA
jgi:ABC-type lipoprotein export system ATPase subunit